MGSSMKLFHDQSPRKYRTGPGSNSRPLDLQSDSHLLPNTLPTAPRGPVPETLLLTNVIRMSIEIEIPFFLYSVCVLLDFSLTVKAATLIFISGCGSAILSAKQGKSGLLIIW